MPAPAVSIVLPTYNERENIRLLVPRIEETFRDVPPEVLVVDDASPDGTAGEVEALQARYPSVRLLRRPGREGLGAALREAYDAARGDMILSSDSDGTFPPEAMRQLYEACVPGVDIVVGARNGAGGKPQSWRAVVQRTLSRVGNRGFRLVTGVPVGSFSVNFRIFRRETWRRLETRERSNAFLAEMLSSAAQRGLTIREMPVTFHDRIHGESKFRLTREGPRFVRLALSLALRHRIGGQ